jgi:riboflavin synthase
LRYELHPGDAHLVVPQGSIAINGVSLTLASVEANSFSVALISHTLDNTNLSKLPLGAEVNLEYDILGKYIARLHQFPKEQNKLDLQGF